MYKITIAILKTGVYQGVLRMVTFGTVLKIFKSTNWSFGNQNKGVRMILEYFSLGKGPWGRLEKSLKDITIYD